MKISRVIHVSYYVSIGYDITKLKWFTNMCAYVFPRIYVTLEYIVSEKKGSPPGQSNCLYIYDRLMLCCICV